MAYTGFARTQTGQTVYAQTRPAEDVVDWVASAIAGVEDSTVPGQYWFDGLDESKSYEAYIQAGASPARSDLAFWEFPEVLATGGGGTGTGPIALTVKVVDEEAQPIAQATVSIVGTAYGGFTDAFGNLLFNLQAATYDVRVQPPGGYDTPADQQINLTVDSTLTFVAPATGEVPVPSDRGWIG